MTDIALHNSSGLTAERDTNRYNLLARVLHWVSAIIILWAIVTGIYAGQAGDTATARAIGEFNVALTALFVPVFALRILNRLTSPAPDDIVEGRMAFLAHGAHIALYGMVSLVLVSGLVAVDHSVTLIGPIDLYPAPLAPETRETARLVHKYLCYGLALLIVLHLAAIVFHRRQGRNILPRMTL